MPKLDDEYELAHEAAARIGSHVATVLRWFATKSVAGFRPSPKTTYVKRSDVDRMARGLAQRREATERLRALQKAARERKAAGRAVPATKPAPQEPPLTTESLRELITEAVEAAFKKAFA